MTKKVVAAAMAVALGLLLTASPSQAGGFKVSTFSPPTCCSY
ncbi:MAG TPA: hypothetical protein VMV52_06045 [Candidatus Nanopelagicaceae bacterium]|nr:hypothetical protein [Candidatus Nanopelagicaceae bacterium]